MTLKFSKVIVGLAFSLIPVNKSASVALLSCVLFSGVEYRFSAFIFFIENFKSNLVRKLLKP